MNNLEYIIEDIYNEQEKKEFLKFLNPKNWNIFYNLLSSFSSLIKYKKIIKDIIIDKSQETKKLTNLFVNLKNNPETLSITINQLIKNEAQKNGLKITDLKKIIKDALESPNPIRNILSLLNSIIKKLNNQKIILKEDFSFDIQYFSEFLFEEVIRIQNLNVINEVIIKPNKPKKILTRKEAEKAENFINDFGKITFKPKGKMGFLVILIFIAIKLIEAFSFGSGGLQAQEQAVQNDNNQEEKKYDNIINIVSLDDNKEIKGLQGDIKDGEDTLKNIQDLKSKAVAIEKKISEKKGSFWAKFGFTDTAKEVEKMEADLKALKTAVDGFGDSEKIKNDIESKKAELEKFNKSLENKKGILKYLTSDDFGKVISDQEVKEAIQKELTAQSIKFLDQGNKTIKEATDAKTGLFNKTLSQLESQKTELQKATPETKADVVNKYLEEVQKGKVVDKDTKTALDDIKKLEVKADLLKKAGFAVAEKKVTTKDLDVFAKKSLAEQVSKILNPDNPAEYDIEYTYDAKNGEVKIDTTTEDYKALQQDIKILKNDPDFKNFNKTFKETISKIGGDINKLTKSVEKLQELKDEKETLKEKLDKADKDKPSIQQKIDKIDAEFEKVSNNQDQYGVMIGLEALQDLADSKDISVKDAIKMYKGFQLNDQIEMKIKIAKEAAEAAEAKGHGFTDLNEFKHFKSLLSKAGWTPGEQKLFFDSMKKNRINLSNIDLKDINIQQQVYSNIWAKNDKNEWVINNKAVEEFKKLVEAKINTKIETKDTKEQQEKDDSDVLDSDDDSSIANAVKSNFKSLNDEVKSKIKTSVQNYKDSKDNLKQYDENSLQYKFAKSIMSDESKKIRDSLTGNAKKYFNIEKHIELFESKKEVSELFTILEQNYFNK